MKAISLVREKTRDVVNLSFKGGEETPSIVGMVKKNPCKICEFTKDQIP